MEKAQLNAILHELRQHLEALYGEHLVHIILYGSQARGDATPESDIDVMVVLRDSDEEIEAVSYIVADLSLKYDTLISRLFISEDRFLHEHSPFLINVRREGILL